MTSIGLLKGTNGAVRQVVTQLKDKDKLKRARVHPLSVLVALRTYGSGHGVRGKLSWSPVSQIVDSLDKAFYLSFDAVEPTGKRWLQALDVSGSMSAAIAGMPGVNCREASAAMAMVTAAVEDFSHVIGFTSNGRGGGYSYGRKAPNWKAVQGYAARGLWGGSSGAGVSVLDISPRRRLDDNIQTISGLDFGGTDCALPMIYALQEGIEVDVFAVYTDNETWAGSVQPVQALAQYRKKTGIDAKLIVVGMTATEFSIADPKDRGMLDVVGFDGAAPKLMAEFAKGNV
jgi:60 kDa SS-A/Ro ribonucleoprotein